MRADPVSLRLAGNPTGLLRGSGTRLFDPRTGADRGSQPLPGRRRSDDGLHRTAACGAGAPGRLFFRGLIRAAA